MNLLPPNRLGHTALNQGKDTRKVTEKLFAYLYNAALVSKYCSDDQIREEYKGKWCSMYARSQESIKA
jgi:hypothetical protein